MSAKHTPVRYSPENPPPLRRDGETVEDYRVRCGWDAPKARAQHTPPGPNALLDAGVSMTLRIGQRVRHCKGRRVIGVVQAISLYENALQAEIGLDEPIVIDGASDRPIRIYRQSVPAHELSPFDERDEVISDLLAALEEARNGLLWYRDRNPGQSDGSDDEAMARIDAAIAKAVGSQS